MDRGDAGAALNGTETVLVVDDDASVRRAVRRILGARGYAVVEADHAEQALEILARAGADIHLVLTDVIMPGMGGPQLAALLARTRPRLPVLFMSGYTGDPADWPRAEDGTATRWPLLQKPFTPDELTSAVRAVLGGKH